MSSLIQIRRGYSENLPALSVGELALAVDSKEVFVGTLDGNVSISRALQAYTDEYNAFLDEIGPLVSDIREIHAELSIEQIEALMLELENLPDYTSDIQRIEQLATEAKQSASDGKEQVALAITGKGVYASGTDTFAQLASAISSIPSQEGNRVRFGSLPAGGGTIDEGYPIKLIVSLNANDNELVTLSPEGFMGFGVGQGYDYEQGRASVVWDEHAMTATVSGAHFDNPCEYLVIC